MPITKRPNRKFFELAGHAPYPIQEQIYASKAKRRIACLGRQVGKSEAASIEAVFELIVNPGSEGWIVAPTYDQAEIIFRRVLQRAEDIAEKLPHLHVKASARKLRLQIEHYDVPYEQAKAERRRPVAVSEFRGKSADRPDNLRGATLDFLIVDEAAMIPFSVWTEALEPLLSKRDGWALIISTPKGYNWFYRFFRLGWAGRETTDPDVRVPEATSAHERHPDFESFHMTSWEVHAHNRGWYMERRQYIPDIEFRQEYGAEFISNSGSVFDALDMIVRLPFVERGQRLVVEDFKPDREYIIGADFGKNQDFSVYSVVDLATGATVCIERANEVSWKKQIAALKRLSQDYGDALVVADAWGVGDVLMEDLQAYEVPYYPVQIRNTVIKEELIKKFSLHMSEGSVALPDSEIVFDELRNFRYQKTASGTSVMRAYGRGHDDIVLSLALAYFLFERGDPSLIDPDLPAKPSPDDEPDPQSVVIIDWEEFDRELNGANRMFM